MGTNAGPFFSFTRTVQKKLFPPALAGWSFFFRIKGLEVGYFYIGWIYIALMELSVAGLDKLMKKDPKQAWLEEQEARMRAMLGLVKPELDRKDFFRTIERYYDALNFFFTFEKHEGRKQKEKLEGEIFSVYKEIFHGIAEEVELANVGDRYSDAMQTYELARVFYEDSAKYLTDARRKEIYGFVDKIYTSIITLVKLHERAGK